MDYKKDFNIKPKLIRKNGVVLFTDGTNDVMPNERACLAYGYTYNDGICKAYVPSKITEDKRSNESTKDLGSNKVKKSQATSVVGQDNLVEGAKNTLVVGDKHVVEADVSNAAVFGGMGKATHTGEFVLGGGGYQSEAGLLQYSILNLATKTIDASSTHLTIQGDGERGNQITLPANSVTTYEIWLQVLVTGGSSGTPGEYYSHLYQGTIRTTNDGVLTHNAITSTELGHTIDVEVSIDTSTASTLKIAVVGIASMNISWYAVVKLHINKTNAAEF